jgi:hypothetical protein
MKANAITTYGKHLRNFYRVFPQSQVFIIRIDEIVKNTRQTMKRLQQFLLLGSGWKSRNLPQYNRKKMDSKVLDCDTYDRLYDFFYDDYHFLPDWINNELKSVFQPHFESFQYNRSY